MADSQAKSVADKNFRVDNRRIKMRMSKRAGNFFLVLLFNMVLNFELSIPAWILLALHYFLGWRILWFWIALGIWILSIVLWMEFLGFASDCSNEKPYRENKNPYSASKDKYSFTKDNSNEKH